MALTIITEIRSDDASEWDAIKTRVAAVDAAYTIDDSAQTARMKFSADWDGKGVASMQLEEPA